MVKSDKSIEGNEDKPDREVKLCGVTHKITYKKDNFNKESSNLGYIDYVTGTIVINSNASEDIQNESLCHELVHGMLFHLGYNEECGNEKFIQALGNAIYQTFEVRYEK